LLAIGAALLVAAPHGGGVRAAGPESPAVSYPRDATVVVAYREVLGEVAGDDRGPAIRIHGDGQIEVHVPPYFKRAGEYRGRLTPAELDALVASLAARGVLDFDADATRAAQARARADRRARAARDGTLQVVVEVSDPPLAVFEIEVDRVTTDSTGGRRAARLRRTIEWRGLATDAVHYPEIAALRDLAAAEVDVRGLMKRDDFEKVR
jgi:hypothetical protein